MTFVRETPLQEDAPLLKQPYWPQLSSKVNIVILIRLKAQDQTAGDAYA